MLPLVSSKYLLAIDRQIRLTCSLACADAVAYRLVGFLARVVRRHYCFRNSVCLSHSWSTPKQFKISMGLHHTIPQCLRILRAKFRGHEFRGLPKQMCQTVVPSPSASKSWPIVYARLTSVTGGWTDIRNYDGNSGVQHVRRAPKIQQNSVIGRSEFRRTCRTPRPRNDR